MNFLKTIEGGNREKEEEGAFKEGIESHTANSKRHEGQKCLPLWKKWGHIRQNKQIQMMIAWKTKLQTHHMPTQGRTIGCQGLNDRVFLKKEHLL